MDRDTMLYLFYGKTGNSAYFKQLYKRYSPMINGMLFQMGILERAEREELLQQVFYKTVEKRKMFQPSARFSTWLYKIAHNSALTFLRNQAYRRSQRLDFGPESESSPLEGLVKKERDKRVLKAVHSLGRRQREALVLRDFMEISYADIGEIMDLSKSAVESLIYHARQKLKIRLKGVLHD
jgi:RNA polymerase sigma-70 factor (ECF subfamily)